MTSLTCENYVTSVHEFYEVSQAFCSVTNVVSNSLVCIYTYFHFLILLSGDIETNPGPIPQKDENSLQIFHLNIRSFRNKRSFLSEYLSEYDIVAFSETHLDNQIK